MQRFPLRHRKYDPLPSGSAFSEIFLLDFIVVFLIFTLVASVHSPFDVIALVFLPAAGPGKSHVADAALVRLFACV